MVLVSQDVVGARENTSKTSLEVAPVTDMSRLDYEAVFLSVRRNLMMSSSYKPTEKAPCQGSRMKRRSL